MALPLVIVAAVADNGVIGRDNGLVWHLRSDLKRFKALTMGQPLLMGRATFQSIGKPLPGRETIVLTRDAAFRPVGVHVAHALDAAIALADRLGAAMGARALMVVGGRQVFADTLPLAVRIHLTQVHAAPEGDVIMPQIDRSRFRETLREDHPAGEGDDHPFTFVDLERI